MSNKSKPQKKPKKSRKEDSSVTIKNKKERNKSDKKNDKIKTVTKNKRSKAAKKNKKVTVKMPIEAIPSEDLATTEAQEQEIAETEINEKEIDLQKVTATSKPSVLNAEKQTKNQAESLTTKPKRPYKHIPTEVFFSGWKVLGILLLLTLITAIFLRSNSTNTKNSTQDKATYDNSRYKQESTQAIELTSPNSKVSTVASDSVIDTVANTDAIVDAEQNNPQSKILISTEPLTDNNAPEISSVTKPPVVVLKQAKANTPPNSINYQQNPRQRHIAVPAPLYYGRPIAQQQYQYMPGPYYNQPQLNRRGYTPTPPSVSRYCGCNMQTQKR